MSPTIPRRRSSMLSASSGPHTPPQRDTPLPMLPTASNRNSSDSWNSVDIGDDMTWEWTPEQLRLLSRTLDALPAHLLTPFNGPVPPSNLLDKIARGVANAKGPDEWPHSLRATRAKIVELARLRGSEDTSSDTIAEEDSTDPEIFQQTTNIGPKRLLHRQSSMDFMHSPKIDLQGNASIRRLSHRLQDTTRMLPNPAYHPYARPGPHRILPSTPSSTTLNSVSSCGSISRGPRLRRSKSSMSNSSDSFVAPKKDVRLQRIKRADSFAGSALYGPGSPMKRAPSFGAISKCGSDAMSVDMSPRDSDVTSDEEEKQRSKSAKKPRLKATSPTPPASPEQYRKVPKTPSKARPRASTPSAAKETHPPRPPTKARANLQRNPSILGPELPQPPPASPTASRGHTRVKERKSPKANTPTTPRTERAPTAPPSERGLRRTNRPGLMGAPVARKITFGAPPAAEGSPGERSNAGPGLDSAFQLQ